MTKREREHMEVIISYCAFKSKNDKESKFIEGYDLGANDVKGYIENRLIAAGIIKPRPTTEQGKEMK